MARLERQVESSKFGGANEGLPWPLAIIIFRGKPKL